MKMFKILGLTLAAAGLMAITAQAVPIVGSVGFTGTYSHNGANQLDLQTATEMTIIGVAVAPFSPTGDFVGAGAPLSFASPIYVNAGVGGNVGNQLWSVTVGGNVYTLDITSANQVFASATQLNLTGNGLIERNGADTTTGTWQISFGLSGNDVGNASFTWQSTSAANVPEGGSTLILLGSAIVGLFGIARKSLRSA